MGCDIHPAIEVREHPEYKEDAFSWSFVAMPDRDRNYEFFSLLAGVRGEYDPWVERRGMPQYPNYMTYNAKNEPWPICSGDHSASWFTLAEARTFVVPPSAHDYTHMQWKRWFETMEFFATQYNVPGDCVRVVFNFDS